MPKEEMNSLKDELEKEKAAKKKEKSDLKNLEVSAFDMEQIDEIVERMKKKYSEQGLDIDAGGSSGQLGELREIIAEGKTGKVEIQAVEDLKESKTPAARVFGKTYLSFKGILEPIHRWFSRAKYMDQLSYYLYSANLRYSSRHYLAISLGASLVVFFIGIILAIIFAGATSFDIPIKMLVGITTAIVFPLMAFGIMLYIPRSIAKARGDAISIELPFALRHMATELKSGIGLYMAIQAVALADYGVLSEEFAKTVTEIEEGTDARKALKHMALRTQSKALRNTLMHIIRAMETGGNLSQIMNEIAEDVSFELRIKVKDFAQKMNFFGLIFIFVAIVTPVIITILGMIRNSPINAATDTFNRIPLSMEVITVYYLLVIPLTLGGMVLLIKVIQPKV